LNLNISDSRQNIKNLVGTFGALHVGNIHANFQASNSTGVGGGDRRKDRRQAILAGTVIKFLNSPLRFASGGIKANPRVSQRFCPDRD